MTVSPTLRSSGAAFKKMLGMIKTGEIERVMVKGLSRLGRNFMWYVSA